MKKKVLLFMFLLAVNLTSKATNWSTYFTNAKKLAAASNKFILVDFWATWCGPCKRMDTEAWSDAEVKSLMSNFVPLKIDIDYERNIASKYFVRSIPDVAIMDANGEVVFHNVGYMNKTQVVRFLKKYSYQTQYVQKDLIDFMVENSGKNALKLAETYFDFSIFVKKEVRNDFLKIGEKYLLKARKFYKKNKNANTQKLNLLDKAYVNLIRGKYEKVLNKIDTDFEETEIKEENKLLYTFIKFTAFNKLGDKENAKVWYEKLRFIDNDKKTLLKSRKI